MIYLFDTLQVGIWSYLSYDKGPYQLTLHHLYTQYAFNVATLFILGIQSENDRICLTKACESIVKGFGAWRIYFPGTSYYNACQVYIPSFLDFLSIMQIYKIHPNIFSKSYHGDSNNF